MELNERQSKKKIKQLTFRMAITVLEDAQPKSVSLDGSLEIDQSSAEEPSDEIITALRELINDMILQFQLS